MIKLVLTLSDITTGRLISHLNNILLGVIIFHFFIKTIFMFWFQLQHLFLLFLLVSCERPLKKSSIAIRRQMKSKLKILRRESSIVCFCLRFMLIAQLARFLVDSFFSSPFFSLISIFIFIHCLREKEISFCCCRRATTSSIFFMFFTMKMEIPHHIAMKKEEKIDDNTREAAEPTEEQ